jgi:hypothetical protein
MQNSSEVKSGLLRFLRVVRGAVRNVEKWKDYNISLTNDGMLRWYSSKPGRELKGEESTLNCRVDTFEHSSSNYCMNLYLMKDLGGGKRRKIVLGAKTFEERDEWINALSSFQEDKTKLYEEGGAAGDDGSVGSIETIGPSSANVQRPESNEVRIAAPGAFRHPNNDQLDANTKENAKPSVPPASAISSSGSGNQKKKTVVWGDDSQHGSLEESRRIEPISDERESNSGNKYDDYQKRDASSGSSSSSISSSSSSTSSGSGSSSSSNSSSTTASVGIEIDGGAGATGGSADSKLHFSLARLGMPGLALARRQRFQSFILLLLFFPLALQSSYFLRVYVFVYVNSTFSPALCSAALHPTQLHPTQLHSTPLNSQTLRSI